MSAQCPKHRPGQDHLWYNTIGPDYNPTRRCKKCLVWGSDVR